jgi:hypothetical protein
MTMAFDPTSSDQPDSLREFMEAQTDAESGNISLETPYARKVFDSIQNQDRTRALIATSFWQLFRFSDARYRVATELGVAESAFFQGDHIVVARSDISRFDLLVLTKQPISPRSTRVYLSSAEFSSAEQNWRASVQNPGPYNDPNLGIEVGRSKNPFSIVVAGMPPLELMKIPGKCVTIDIGGTGVGTVGVVAEDNHGRKGVTTALHVVGSHSAVNVDGHHGTIVTKDTISDSCFIEVSPTPSTRSVSNGVMKGILPRGQQKASFEGDASGSQQTVIDAWSLELPSIQGYNQLKLYTPKVTDPGDSGATLVTDDDYIVGFAFERSAFGANPSFSSWIWAHAVYHALDLKYP